MRRFSREKREKRPIVGRGDREKKTEWDRGFQQVGVLRAWEKNGKAKLRRRAT